MLCPAIATNCTCDKWAHLWNENQQRIQKALTSTFLLCLSKEVKEIEWIPIASWLLYPCGTTISDMRQQCHGTKIQQQKIDCEVQDGKTTGAYLTPVLELFNMPPAKSVFNYDCLLALRIRKTKQGKSYVALTSSVRNTYRWEQNLEHRKQMAMESIKLHFKMC